MPEEVFSKKPMQVPKHRFAKLPDFDKMTGKIIHDTPVEVADTYTHASSFNNWCRRREVYRVIKQAAKIAVPRSKFAPAMKKLFEVGHAIHNHFRDTVLSSLLCGSWKCVACGQLHTAETPIPCPDKCEKCGAVRHHATWHSFHFVEAPLIAPELQLTGSNDGFIMYMGKTRVLELKSMNPDKWKLLQRPMTGHVTQVQAYIGMLREQHQSQVNTGVIVYVNKTTGAMKAFLVPFEPAIFDWVKAESLAVVELGKKYAAATAAEIKVLARNPAFNADAPIVCKAATASMASSCASCRECFMATSTKKGHA